MRHPGRVTRFTLPLVGDHDLDVSVAFELLRRHARNNNRNIHDVAAEVVDGTLHL